MTTPDLIPTLSRRERSIAELVAAEQPDKVISAELGIAVPTIRTHMRHICAKLHCMGRVGIAVQVERHRLLSS